ncbi:hypothetical protein T12_8633 [Trichinella patagoniensis]|uniref:Uncharacterized protein n=1 Tax=Trichinella patagoniensis TaxID=990121 RepID=A0A0V0ZU65_9BILA|nr:hypothetical protein T12_8633 [Trichinella patagoniensis]
MADVPELHLVQNRCGEILEVLKDKKGLGGAIWINLDVTSVIEQNDHIESCPMDEHLVYKMEKKALLKKEASAASAEPSTFGHFPLFKRVKSMMYSNRTKRYPELPKYRRDKISSTHLTINLNLIDIKMKHF